ncbi:hypothetical protein G7Y89_g8763 [Cudoniella acicularis]|uniref:NAD(P)-binding domain-containing protein n=1 Tax=Cudoniella acicularis TaxID=354080 RepID=A0A8H4RFZ3_9HELO|nr:hypothetical protein G7Y89_g8763 [Cudoniella acicularis]
MMAILEKLFNNPNYSPALVEDLDVPGPLDEAVKGVDAIVFTATKLPGPVDRHKIILETVAGVMGILKSAVSESSMKRFVYTGTFSIAFRLGQTYKNDSNTWADDTVAAAFAPPPNGFERIFVNYKAAKDRAEWAIPPMLIFGRIITSPSETGEWPKGVMNGNETPFGGLGPTATFNWNKLIDVVRKLKPSAKVTPHLTEPNIDLGDNDNALEAALLAKWWDQKGYTLLEQTIRENLASGL